MRVYEFAKQHNVSSKEVLDFLKKHKIELANHMAVLPEKAIEILQKTAQKAAEAAAAQSAAAKAKEPSASAQKSAPKHAAKSSQKADAKSGAKTAQKQGESSPASADTAKSGAYGKNNASKNKKKSGSKKGDGRPVQNRDYFRTSRETVVTESAVDSIEVAPDISLGAVAELMKKSPTELIFVLLKKGIVRNVNNALSLEEMQVLGEAFGVLVVEKGAKAATVDDAKGKSGDDSRLPVIVIMGHVDHGKTTLLDYLRKTNVADREKGGITQHLGAYEVATGASQNLIFLDTPGHEAFTYMRSRGARITDIAIIIVAANDGIKPQTVEAIELAKKAGVPIVIAVNKIDKIQSDSQLDTVRTQLSQHDLTPEEWGGETVCVPISAKTGQGVDTLLEMLALHAEMLDLKTTIEKPAHAFVLETRQVKGQGWAATVICREGTLRRGDFFVCGKATGKVRLLIDSAGKQVNEVGPSVPVQVVGFDTVNGLGDHLQVVSRDAYSKAKSVKEFRAPAAPSAPVAGDSGQEVPTVRLLCKADMQGSAQAVSDAIAKMVKNKKNQSVRIELIACEVGPVTEGDVIRAIDTDAHLFALHVRAERNAQLLAKEKNITITSHGIIYHMLEQIEEMIKIERQKVVHLVESGAARVLKVFPIKNRRVIAGCEVTRGVLRSGDKVVCYRGREEIGSGIVVSLQRDRKEAKEIHEGNDCGFLTDNFHAWKEGDKVTIFTHEREED